LGADATGKAPQAAEHTFEFSGGRLCLDFANTVSGSRTHPKEHLNTYEDLVAWGRQAGVITDEDARRLAQLGRRRQEDAAAVLAEAVRLREAMFRIFCGAADCLPPGPDDMNAVNAALGRALAHVRLEATPDGCVNVWNGERDALDRMLWPVLRSAMDLLTTEEERTRVHKCENDGCDWLFLDTSRNRSRRWCDMKSCGNRAKARRYYERHKSGHARGRA
jgi:predicted RNA-binding Zn ribbon-like protein